MYLLKQLVAAGLGLICMYICHRQNYLIYNKLAPILFLLAIPLLVYTLFFGVGDQWRQTLDHAFAGHQSVFPN